MQTSARRIGVALCGTLLPSVLAGLIITGTIWAAIGNGNHVKQWLDRSTAYDNLVPVLLTESNRSLQKTENTLPTDNPAIISAFEASFPSSLIKQQAETFITGTYAWIDGQTVRPDFTLDLSEAKRTLANRLGAYVQDRLEALEICKNQAWTTVDVFTISCRPETLTASEAAQDIEKSILQDTSFLGNGIILAKEISFSSESKQPYYEQLSSLPSIHNTMQLLPWMLGVVAILIVVVMLYLSPDRQKTSRHLAFLFIFSGILAIIFGFIGTLTAEWIRGVFLSDSATGSTFVEKIIYPIIDTAAGSIAKTPLFYGIGYLVAGIFIGLLGLNTHRTRQAEIAGQVKQLSAAPIGSAPSQIPTVSPLQQTAATPPQQSTMAVAPATASNPTGSAPQAPEAQPSLQLPPVYKTPAAIVKPRQNLIQ